MPNHFPSDIMDGLRPLTVAAAHLYKLCIILHLLLNQCTCSISKTILKNFVHSTLTKKDVEEISGSFCFFIMAISPFPNFSLFFVL